MLVERNFIFIVNFLFGKVLLICIMVEVRVVVMWFDVGLYVEGISIMEGEVELLKSIFKFFKRCVFRIW